MTTDNLTNTVYKAITIFKKTYNLPVIGGDSFNNLQDSIQQRQAIIKTGKRQETNFVIFKSQKEITFEERFVELDYLIKDYNTSIAFLKQHKDSYQSFFVSLTDELKELVAEKLMLVLKQEQKRQQLEQKYLQKKSNPEFLKEIQKVKTENYQNLFKFGNAFLLMLKKVDLISKGIEKLVNDQDPQKKILDKMVDNLSDYKEFYELKKEIAKTRAEAEILTGKALNLEKILQPVFGEFQGLINQIVSIDSEFNSTISQMQNLVQNLTNSEVSFIFEGYNQISNNLLDFLVINEQKKAVLTDALNQAQTKTTDFLLNNYQLLDECVEIDTAIANIEAKVTQQLTKMSSNFQQTIDVTAKPVIITPSVQVKANHRDFTETLTGGIKLEMIAISTGEFMMGSNDENDNEKPVHKVKLKEFYIGKYPITQAQYRAIMGNNPSYFKDTSEASLNNRGWWVNWGWGVKDGWDDHPIEQVSWEMAQEFCQKISQKTGKKYKLPSEAQWEYACRAGSTGKWSFGDDQNQLKDYAWYNDNSDSQTHPVGQKKPNKWGLYDMHGNVWEWCEDDYADNYNNTLVNGASYINQSRKYKCLRGGSWGSDSYNCRSARRNNLYPRGVNRYDGFRVMCAVF